MAEPLHRLSDPELERALIDLGPRLAHPPTPDLARAVRARLTDAPGRHPPPRHPLARWPWPRPTPRTAALAAVALLLLAVGLLALFPGARTAVADRLGLRGVRILFVEEVPTPQPAPVGSRLSLGQRVTLDEARDEVPFTVHVPTLDDFDRPDEVYLSRIARDGMVSFVYRPRPDLPLSPDADVGALLTQFRGDTQRDLVTKGLFTKGVSPATRLESVTVNGGRGFWIDGAAHGFFMYRDALDQYQQEEYRLAGNVLLWEQNGLTFRLESALSKEEALRIAASVHTTD